MGEFSFKVDFTTFNARLISQTDFLFCPTQQLIYLFQPSGMDSYPVSSQRLEHVPESLLAGVLGGVGFMGLALAVLLGSACIVSRKMGRRCRLKRDGKNPPPPTSRESAADTHFDEVHHEYNNLFNKILRALLLHYINHTTPLDGSGSSALPLIHSVVKVIDVIYFTR